MHFAKHSCKERFRRFDLKEDRFLEGRSRLLSDLVSFRNFSVMILDLLGNTSMFIAWSLRRCLHFAAGIAGNTENGRRLS